MCIDITMIDQADADKLSVLLDDLNDSKPLTESQNPLGIILGVAALMLQAGETLHLPPIETIDELVRRAKINTERAQAGERPLMTQDFLRETLRKTLAALDEEAQNGGTSGVVPPEGFTPQEHTILPPKGNDEDKPSDDGDAGFGLYL